MCVCGDISLRLLDLGINSIKAGADLIDILVSLGCDKKRYIEMSVKDNGCGMDDEDILRLSEKSDVTDKNSGNGIFYLKTLAQNSGGDFKITNQNKGLCVYAKIYMDSDNSVQVGAIEDTLATLIISKPNLCLNYVQRANGREYKFFYENAQTKSDVEKIQEIREEIRNGIFSF